MDPANAFICIEFAEGGTLRAYIHGGGGALKITHRISLLQNLTSALSFTHEHNIFHRDVKPENVLLFKSPSSSWIAKLSDFGLSKFKDKSGGSSSAGGGVGTYAYMAPDVLEAMDTDDGANGCGAAAGAAAAEKSAIDDIDWCKVDVYALGVLGYEMFAQEEPFKGLNILNIFRRVVTNQQRPGEIPDSAPRSVKDAIQRSWAQKASDRPNAAQINAVLTAELASLASRESGQQEAGESHVNAVGAWLATIGIADDKVQEIASLVCGEDFGVETPKDFLELEEDDLETVLNMLPKVKKKGFRRAL
jgi:serine/threonine protein kinase